MYFAKELWEMMDCPSHRLKGDGEREGPGGWVMKKRMLNKIELNRLYTLG